MEDGFALQDATVGIVGLGLMGGSLAMRLKGKCARLIGFDSDPATLELALSKKIVDRAESLLPHPRSPSSRSTPEGSKERRVDLLIIATPIPIILNILQQLPELIQPPCIVMDIGSTKREIIDAMAALPNDFDPIGGHPICGREKLGLEHASADLYQDAPFVITSLERTTDRAKSAARQIITAMGANRIELNAEEHDLILAHTSHLPFLIASSLAQSTPCEFARFIGPGFRSTTRLASTPAHMMMGILKSNRDHVLT